MRTRTLAKKEEEEKENETPSLNPIQARRPISISIPSLPKDLTPFLVLLIIIASFLLGMLFTKVQYLEKGSTTVAAANTGTQPSQAPQGNQPSQAPVKANVGVGHFPVKGDKNAKVTVIEFADFRCPFCEKVFTDVESQLQKDYIDTGKVKFYFRQYAFLGPASTVAANAAECANEQNKFWDMHDYLYKNQPSESDTSMYTTDNLTQIAGTLGMNTDQFRTCLSSNKYNKNVTDDFTAGQKAGVSATPTFYIDGNQLVGAQPYSAFQTLIDQELKK